MKLILLMGVLFGAPLFSQTGPLDPVVKNGEVKWWLLTETPAEVRATAGTPTMVADFEGFLSWQHQLPGADHEDEPASQMLFSRSTGKLVSATRSYAEDIDVSAFFPEAETSLHQFPNAEHPTFRALVRHLSGGRILIASGLASGPGRRSAQLVLIRQEELKRFFPWIAVTVEATKTPAKHP